MSGMVADRHRRRRQRSSQDHLVFSIERRGIDPVPDAERTMEPGSLFWLWAGALTNVEYFFYGALVMSAGLSLAQAVACIVIGNLTFALLGWASLQGPATGTTSFTVSRAPFGPRRNRPIAFFNWLTQVGFGIEGIYYVTTIVVLLLSMHGVLVPAWAKAIVLVVVAAAQLAVPLLGHATITRSLRYLGYGSVAFFAVIAAFTLSRLHLATFRTKPASAAVFSTALVLVVIVGGMNWAENGNDYSRYLPRVTRAARTFWAATLGAAIPAAILELLGMLAFTVTTRQVGTADLSMPQSFPGWLVTPFLIVAVVQLYAMNTIYLYSSGVTLQAVGVPVRRWAAVAVNTITATVVAGILLFSKASLYAYFSGFLLYLIVWMVPWFAILLVDCALRRNRYDTRALLAGRGSRYWYSRGIHWPAVIAHLIGMVATTMWLNASNQPGWMSYTGPLSGHFPGLAGGDLSWAIGFASAGLAYWLLAVRSASFSPCRVPLRQANFLRSRAAASGSAELIRSRSPRQS
jgi:NCS1 family nucleobase:cation symporter-1